jgi:hypothetical protein
MEGNLEIREITPEMLQEMERQHEQAQANREAPEAPREYLGDGAYAFFDGWSVCVEAERDGIMHWVGFEPHVMEAFIRFAKQHYPNLEV